MTAIVRAGAAGAGTELGLAEQGFKCLGKSRIGKQLAAQVPFGFGGAERSRGAGADGDVDVFDDVLFAFEPNRAVQNGKRDALRTHDALEAGRLMVIGNW